MFEVYRNVTTGTIIETMRRDDRMFVAICTNHGGSSEPVPYREHAHRSSRFPQGWCAGCQRLLGITKPDLLPDPDSLTRCDGCGDLRTGVVRFGHVDAPTDQFMALCKACWKRSKVRERYYERFAEQIAASREKWRGMSKRERQQAMKRIAIHVNQQKGST